ncbi:hypothetical protein RRG08_021374 [Elysia crispata]|uniref:Uncharacterized protein n=1 Tax=Elysia crispata TaxID=231223 RepID=A0AAE1CWJ0_9GAST|nr:hypothetical protein RRG08_021374 [Elysia crispata]
MLKGGPFREPARKQAIKSKKQNEFEKPRNDILLDPSTLGFIHMRYRKNKTRICKTNKYLFETRVAGRAVRFTNYSSGPAVSTTSQRNKPDYSVTRGGRVIMLPTNIT